MGSAPEARRRWCRDGRDAAIPVSVLIIPFWTLQTGVFIGSVIDNGSSILGPRVGLDQQLIHVVECAEQRIDVLIVGNIVAIIVLRRLVYRG